jgi:polar amino acid transport system substrate-binding protein
MNTISNFYAKLMFGVILMTVSAMLSISFRCAAETSLTIATGANGIYSSETEVNGGVFPDITRAALQRMGYAIDLKFVPWKRGLQLSREGVYDGLMVVSFKEERLAYFHYSDAVLHNEGYLYTQRGKSLSYVNLQELTPYTIGTIRGLLFSDLLQAKNVHIEEVATHEQNIQKLMAERVDLIAAPKLVIRKVLNSSYPKWKDSIEQMNLPFYAGSLHFVISRKNPQHQKIINDFNKGLQAIHADGSFENILRAHGFSEAGY